MLRLLENTARNIGKPPRDIDVPSKDLSNWSDDPIANNELYAHEIAEQGRLELAWIVQANSSLFGMSIQRLPADIVHGVDCPPVALLEIASKIFELKERDHADPEVMKLAAEVRDEYGRSNQVAVPRSFAAGHDLKVSSILVQTEQLPKPGLVSNFFPVLTLPGAHLPIILPGRFWASDLRHAWLDLAVE